jgi:hypothetical protein
MAEYLVELYVSRSDAAGAGQGAERARLAAEQLRREGAAVWYVRSMFVPEDETCFLLYEADSVADVEEAARRASLRPERAVAAVVDVARDERS